VSHLFNAQAAAIYISQTAFERLLPVLLCVSTTAAY
jgi:hypothetical protein